MIDLSNVAKKFLDCVKSGDGFALGACMCLWRLCLNDDYGTGSLRHSLQDRLSKASGKGRSDEITVQLCTSTGWFPIPLFLSLFFPYIRGKQLIEYCSEMSIYTLFPFLLI